MYLQDVMSRVPRSPHSLQALLLSHTSSLDVPKLLFALLQLLLSACVSGRPFDIPFVAPVVRFHVDRVTLPLVVAFWLRPCRVKVFAFQVSLISVVVVPESMHNCQNGRYLV